MLDSGAAIAEPADARLPSRKGRGLRLRVSRAASLPELLDTRHVRSELMRLRAPSGGAAKAMMAVGPRAARTPVGLDER
jgi:hypothetical protein